MNTLTSRFLRLCLSLLVLTSACRSAHAADPKPASIGLVQFGYAGSMPLERWGPVRVTLISHGPAFTGTLQIGYRQDCTQSQIISTSASVGPDGKVPIELVANFPQSPDVVTIALRDAENRLIDSVSYGRIDNTSPPGLLKFPVDQLDGVVGCVGRISAPGILTSRWIGDSLDPWAGLYNQPNAIPITLPERQLKRGARLHAVTLAPGELPHQWAAYDGLEALVLRSEEVSSQIDPDARAALLRWVEGGGRLILVVDQAGEEWRQWLPPDLASSIESLGPARIPAPLDIDAALRQPVLEDSVSLKDSGKLAAIDTAPGGKSTEPTVIDPASTISQELKLNLVPASGFTARTFRLSKTALAKAWTPAWKSGDQSVIVQGPVGFGYVTIVGCDPHLTAALPNREASYRLWLAVLHAPLEDWLSNPEIASNVANTNWWGIRSSGANRYQSLALSTTLNELASNPATRFNPFAVLGVVMLCVLALAVFIGPFDAILLRRRAVRQYSWLTALTWIGLMSFAAAFAPRLFRGDLTTVILRTRVVDQLPDGTTWSAAVGGLFSGSSGEHAFQFIHQPRYVRGVGINETYGNQREILSPIVASLSSTLTSREPACLPEPFDQAQWTFRTFADDGPHSAEDPARITASAAWEGQTLVISIRAPGIPREAQAALNLPQTGSIRASRELVATPVPTPNSPVPEWTFRFNNFDPLPTEPLETPGRKDWPMLNTPGATYESHLPGAERRMLGIESRLHSGRYALLTLSWTQPANDLICDTPASLLATRTCYRILLALPERASPNGATP